MSEAGDGQRKAARERQSYVRHELRAPLAVIYPVLSLLLDGQVGALTSKQRDYLEIVQRNAELLEARIVSATESGWLDCAAVPTQAEHVALEEVVEELLVHRRIMGLDEPRIEVSSGLIVPTVAVADRSHLRTILAGLVGNASRHTEFGGSIRIDIGESLDAETVTLAVRDDGRGMSQAELASAFAFGHAERQTVAPRFGLGIGLWVARELVERNGGNIAIEAAEGTGTTVRVHLPRALREAS